MQQPGRLTKVRYRRPGGTEWEELELDAAMDLGHLGYGMVAVSIVIWAGAAIVWKKSIQPKERT